MLYGLQVVLPLLQVLCLWGLQVLEYLPWNFLCFPLGCRIVYFFFLRATHAAYGSSQARFNWSCSQQPMPQPQQHQIWAMSTTYDTVQGNPRSLTCWVRPNIKPTSSCTRWVRFHEPQWELLWYHFDRMSQTWTHAHVSLGELLNPCLMCEAR